MYDTDDVVATLVYDVLQGLKPLHTADAPPKVVTYSFHDYGFGFDWPYAHLVAEWSYWLPQERAFVRAALTALESVINVDFRESAGTGDIPLALVEEYASPHVVGLASYSIAWSGDTVTSFETVATWAWWAPAEFWLHELGHTLGLKHPFSGNFTLPDKYDNFGYTLMSYDTRYDPGATLFDGTPGAGPWRRFDVMALQSLWGAAEGEMRFGGDNFGSDAGGWTDQEHFPRTLGDIDGDGRTDIIGFGLHGVLVARGTAEGGFGDVAVAGRNFCADDGWTSQERYPRQVGDITGDGSDDVVGFGARQTFSASGTASGRFVGFDGAVRNFSAGQGWVSETRTPRRLGDVDGDGAADIVGFGAAATFTALSNGNGSFGGIVAALRNFTPAQGWSSAERFPRQVGDVNGDGRADIVGFGAARTYVALGQADGSFADPQAGIENFARAQGWVSFDRTPRVLADVDGDGRADIVGFGNARTFVAHGRADGTFGAISTLTTDFTAAAGWRSAAAMPRLAADIDGDGRADLLGFSDDGVLAYLTPGPDGAVAARLPAAPEPDAAPAEDFASGFITNDALLFDF